MAKEAAKKRRMIEFQLNEISAVTSPAQKGAKMLIMKRDGDPVPMTDEQLAAIVKRGKYKLTTPTNGHTHLVEVDDWSIMAGGGTTTCVCIPSPISGGRDHYHSHPYVIGPKGEITIGEADGHTHQIADVPTTKAAENDPPPVNPPATVQKDDEAMTPEQLAKLEADIAKNGALASMTDAQKTHYAKLSGEPAEAFLKMSFVERDQAITKAAAAALDSDPVVYTTKAGVEVRKSAGEAMIAVLKQNDALLDRLDAATATSRDSEAETLAKSWVHMGKPYDEKLKLAKSIVGLPADAKAAALEGIKPGAVAIAPLFKNHGAMDGTGAAAESPIAKLDKLAKDRAKTSNEDYATAYSKVLETTEGGLLYAEARDIQNSLAVH